MSWLVWALLSAFFAGLTAIPAKVGVQGVNSNLATAMRSAVHSGFRLDDRTCDREKFAEFTWKVHLGVPYPF